MRGERPTVADAIRFELDRIEPNAIDSDQSGRCINLGRRAGAPALSCGASDIGRLTIFVCCGPFGRRRVVRRANRSDSDRSDRNRAESETESESEREFGRPARRNNRAALSAPRKFHYAAAHF